MEERAGESRPLCGGDCARAAIMDQGDGRSNPFRVEGLFDDGTQGSAQRATLG